MCPKSPFRVYAAPVAAAAVAAAAASAAAVAAAGLFDSIALIDDVSIFQQWIFVGSVARKNKMEKKVLRLSLEIVAQTWKSTSLISGPIFLMSVNVR